MNSFKFQIIFRDIDYSSCNSALSGLFFPNSLFLFKEYRSLWFRDWKQLLSTKIGIMII